MIVPANCPNKNRLHFHFLYRPACVQSRFEAKREEKTVVRRHDTSVPGFIQDSEAEPDAFRDFSKGRHVCDARCVTSSSANAVKFCFLAVPLLDECEHRNTFRGSAHFVVLYGAETKARQESSGVGRVGVGGVGGGWWGSGGAVMRRERQQRWTL